MNKRAPDFGGDSVLLWSACFISIALLVLLGAFVLWWSQLDYIQNVSNETVPIYPERTPPGAIGYPKSVIAKMKPGKCFEIKERDGNSDFVRSDFFGKIGQDRVFFLLGEM